MTSEAVINQQHGTVPATVSAGMTMFRHMLEEVRGSALLADDSAELTAQAIPLKDIIAGYTLEKDGWKRSLGAIIALLRQAHAMIASAEETILQQEKRIAQLESLATSDELTGINNRRGFREAFVRELDRCERGQTGGGLLILIDLDNFKAINDTYGHAAGDAALRLVAHTLAGEIRPMDTAARLGGDEFVLILCNTTKAEVAGRTQRLGQLLNNLSLAWHGDIIPVRASLGMRAYSKGEKADAIFDAADSQLYADKKGRSKSKAAR